jgi:hypothetical protein
MQTVGTEAKINIVGIIIGKSGRYRWYCLELLLPMPCSFLRIVFHLQELSYNGKVLLTIVDVILCGFFLSNSY